MSAQGNYPAACTFNWSHTSFDALVDWGKNVSDTYYIKLPKVKMGSLGLWLRFGLFASRDSNSV